MYINFLGRWKLLVCVDVCVKHRRTWRWRQLLTIVFFRLPYERQASPDLLTVDQNRRCLLPAKVSGKILPSPFPLVFSSTIQTRALDGRSRDRDPFTMRLHSAISVFHILIQGCRDASSPRKCTDNDAVIDLSLSTSYRNKYLNYGAILHVAL